MSKVNIENLTKKYDDNVVLDQMNLEVPHGSLVAFLGPSGCGKTTTLRLIAGFEEPDEGEIYIDDQSIRGVPVHKRNIGMVFQSYALFPHMTVNQNIAYGLQQRGLPKNEITEKVNKALATVKLEEYGKRRPKQLSGGQQQRVALARALAVEPRVILLDECLSALDKKLRVEMQVELRRILKNAGITSLFVTHDQEEALTLSDHIVVMDKGKIRQIGKPFDVYEHPRSKFVATFLGQANFIIKDGKEYAIRPEKTILSREAPSGEYMEGIVQYATYSGNFSSYGVACSKAVGEEIVAQRQNNINTSQFQAGEKVYISWEPEACQLMEAD